MKSYLLVLALAGLSISSAFSTETRVSTMGGEGWLLVDNSNIFPFPARLVSFPNQVIAELGTYLNDSLGGSIGMAISNNEELSWGVLGLFANRCYPQVASFEELRSLVPDLLIPDLKFDLLYGRQLSGLHTGLGIEWAENFSETQWGDTLCARSSRLLGMRGALHFLLGEESFLDLGLGGRRLSFSIEGDDTVRDRGKFSYDGSGRFFCRIGDFLAVIPYLSLRRDDLSYELTEAGSVVDYTRTEADFRGGVGLNLSPYREMTLVIGILGEKMSSRFESTVDGIRYEYSDTRLTAPALILGLESGIADWLTGRLGARKRALRYERKLLEGDTRETSVSWSAPFDFSLGLGVRLGEFLVDAKLSSDLPFTWGYLPSGRKTEVFTQISATYSFEIF